jgi:hypothetical protein
MPPLLIGCYVAAVCFAVTTGYRAYRWASTFLLLTLALCGAYVFIP